MAALEQILSAQALLEHWQGHRRLTRRTIEAFPKEALFGYRVEPMRSFGEMTLEVLSVLKSNMHGFLAGEWVWARTDVHDKAGLLAAWDAASETLQSDWARLPTGRLLEVGPGYFYGGPPEPHINRVLYFIDNEVHHRAQGYVYLRLLGVEPPPFYER